MKRCIVSAKPHRTVFRFFGRYYDAEEVIHQRIFWNWENISKSGPKFKPKIMKNCIFNEKVHRISKTTQNYFSLFGKILRSWRSESSAHFMKLRKYLKIRAQIRPKMTKNWIFNEKIHRIRKIWQNRFSLFHKILRCWRSDS